MMVQRPDSGPIPLSSLWTPPPASPHVAPSPHAPQPLLLGPPSTPAPETLPSVPTPSAIKTHGQGDVSGTTTTAGYHRSAPHPRPNRLLWRGRLVSPPRVTRSPTGVDYCVVRVVQEVRTHRRQLLTQGIDVILVRDRAHTFAATFRAGDVVDICGELRIHQWTDGRGRHHVHMRLYPTDEIALLERPERCRQRSRGHQDTDVVGHRSHEQHRQHGQ